MPSNTVSKLKLAALLTTSLCLLGCNETQIEPPVTTDEVIYETTAIPSDQSTESQQPGVQDASHDIEHYFKHDSFTLANGLRVIVVEDNAVPTVSVATILHVGAKDEPEGQSGYAHLFEHLLFKGTERNPGDFMKAIRDLGGTGFNAYTTEDTTAYYQTVPKGAVERTIWLEADRLTNTVAGLTKKDVQTEIEIVKNEKGILDTQPWGKAEYWNIEALYPKGHPYAHSPIGSVKDLEAATLKKLTRWHEKYYGSSNAILILSGDITTEYAKEIVTKHFLSVPAGEPRIKHSHYAVQRLENTAQRAEDFQGSSMLRRTYVFPSLKTDEGFHIAIAGEILGGGLGSRLYKTLTDELKLTNYALSRISSKELSSQFSIIAAPVSGVTTDEVSAAIDDIINDFIKKGPTKEELSLYRASQEQNMLANVESPLAKGLYLGEALLKFGDSNFDVKKIKEIDSISKNQIKATAAKWLSKGYNEQHLIGIEPWDAEVTVLSDTPPPIIEATDTSIITPVEFTLNNGLEVALVQKSNAPKLLLTFEIDTQGKILSPKDTEIFSIMNQLLSKSGAPGMNAEEFENFKQRNAFMSSFIESNPVIHFLSEFNTKSFTQNSKVWTDLLLTPQFIQKDLDVIKDINLDQLKQQKAQPFQTANQLSKTALYGKNYALTIDDKMQIIRDLALDDIKDFHKNLVTLEGSRIFAIGDVDKSTLEDALNPLWTDTSLSNGNVDYIDRPFTPPTDSTRFTLVNNEGAEQTTIYAVRRAKHSKEDPYKLLLANKIFGSGILSRLSQKIREENGWTYGITSRVIHDIDQTIWRINTDVNVEYTVETIDEINKQIKSILSNKPITQEEVDETVSSYIKSYGSDLGDGFSLWGYMVNGQRYGNNPAYYNDYVSRLENIKLAELIELTPDVISHSDLQWFITGDLSKFEDKLRKAYPSQVTSYDQSGKLIK